MWRGRVLVIGIGVTCLLCGCSSLRYKFARRYTYPPKRPVPGQPVAAPATRTAVPPATTTPVAQTRPAAAPAPAARPATTLAAPVPKASAPAPSFEKTADSSAMADASSANINRLRAGDPVIVFLRGIPGAPNGEQQIEDIVDEAGAITLPFINQVTVAGRSPMEAETIIRRAYLDQQIYKYITVNVVVPTRSYYVRGEVKQPGRFPLIAGTSIVQALAAAGGFTDFAQPKKVEILRGDKRFTVNVKELEKRPELDKPLESGDVIIVHRSFF